MFLVCIKKLFSFHHFTLTFPTLTSRFCLALLSLWSERALFTVALLTFNYFSFFRATLIWKHTKVRYRKIMLRLGNGIKLFVFEVGSKRTSDMAIHCRDYFSIAKTRKSFESINCQNKRKHWIWLRWWHLLYKQPFDRHKTFILRLGTFQFVRDRSIER